MRKYIDTGQTGRFQSLLNIDLSLIGAVSDVSLAGTNLNLAASSIETI